MADIITTPKEAINMNTEINDVYLVLDNAREVKGEYPEMLTVVSSLEEAIGYASRVFETDDHEYALIERWVMGEESAREAFTLADKLAA